MLDIAFATGRNIDEPRDIRELFAVLLDDLDRLKGVGDGIWQQSGGRGQRAAWRKRQYRRHPPPHDVQRAQSFYSRAAGEPFDMTSEMVATTPSRPDGKHHRPRGLSATARQVIVALISSRLMKAAADKRRPTRPAFIVWEDASPRRPSSDLKNIIKRIAAEGPAVRRRFRNRQPAPEHIAF